MLVAMLSTNFVAGVSHPAHTGENDGSNFCEGQLSRTADWSNVLLHQLPVRPANIPFGPRPQCFRRVRAYCGPNDRHQRRIDS